MTREHLIEDIRNVMAMIGGVERGAESADRVRLSIRGLQRHVENETDVPERVVHCLRESGRVARDSEAGAEEDTWSYARTCLEAALEFAESEGVVSA